LGAVKSWDGRRIELEVVHGYLNYVNILFFAVQMISIGFK
jgi:hypothetical protein